MKEIFEQCGIDMVLYGISIVKVTKDNSDEIGFERIDPLLHIREFDSEET